MPAGKERNILPFLAHYIQVPAYIRERYRKKNRAEDVCALQVPYFLISSEFAVSPPVPRLPTGNSRFSSSFLSVIPQKPYRAVIARGNCPSLRSPYRVTIVRTGGVPEQTPEPTVVDIPTIRGDNPPRSLLELEDIRWDKVQTFENLIWAFLVFFAIGGFAALSYFN